LFARPVHLQRRIMFKLCLVVLCLAAAVQGFMPAFRNGRSLMRQMATLESAKDILLSDGGSGLSKAELNEYILKLEKLNPTEDPALSPLLNGVWEVVSSGIFSPGMVGIQAIKSLPGRLISVEDLTITISNEYPRVTAATEVKVGGAKVKVQVVTDLEVESGLRLKESYVSGKIASLEIPLSTIKT